MAQAAPENNFEENVIRKLYPSVEDWSQSGFFEGERGAQIHYRIYGEAEAQNQPVVIVPGWTEFSLKYIELAHDLIQRGFSPVYVLDHRGQGASERLLKNKERGYVENFYFYVKDLEKFLSSVVAPRETKNNLRLIAHSMGALVSLFYMRDHPQSFKSAVFTAPLLRIKTPETLQTFAVALSRLFSRLSGREQSFLVSARSSDSSFRPDNRLSQSAARYEFNKYLENKHSFFIRGATLKWAREAIEKSRIIRERADQIAAPLLILSAERDRVVDSSAASGFCLKAKQCRQIIMREARHEILMEKDEIRDKALEQISLWLKK